MVEPHKDTLVDSFTNIDGTINEDMLRPENIVRLVNIVRIWIMMSGLTHSNDKQNE